MMELCTAKPRVVARDERLWYVGNEWNGRVVVCLEETLGRKRRSYVSSWLLISRKDAMDTSARNKILSHYHHT